jgi:hypothetical protein
MQYLVGQFNSGEDWQKLKEAELVEAKVVEAKVVEAHLVEAHLVEAHLVEAHLVKPESLSTTSQLLSLLKGCLKW